MSIVPSQLLLAKDVFLCLSDNRFVFLDLRRNKYLCLSRGNTQAAKSIFFGHQDSDPELTVATPASQNERCRTIVEALVQKGLLAVDDMDGKKVDSVCIETATDNILSPRAQAHQPIRSGHRTAFVISSLKASSKLRWYSMYQTVRSVHRRKENRGKSQTANHDTLRQLVAAFHHLRPLYPREYLCLFDSLALLEFLASYRFFPTWVFGVKAEPFGAHCWVQEDNRILNDSVDYVSKFTPIMAI